MHVHKIESAKAIQSNCSSFTLEFSRDDCQLQLPTFTLLASVAVDASWTHPLIAVYCAIWNAWRERYLSAKISGYTKTT